MKIKNSFKHACSYTVGLTGCLKKNSFFIFLFYHFSKDQNHNLAESVFITSYGQNKLKVNGESKINKNKFIFLKIILSKPMAKTDLAFVVQKAGGQNKRL